MCYQIIFHVARNLPVKNRDSIILFGTHLRKLREERNLSQQQLADISNIAKITIQRIENAKFSVTLDVMISISEGLEIKVSDLINL